VADEQEKKTFYRPIEKPQSNLFEGFEAWQREWVGMPEYVQNETVAYATIIVRFASEKDLQDFARRIGQQLTKGKEAKSIWHPQLPAGSGLHVQSDKRYVDES
jgi:hypothetical protein